MSIRSLSKFSSDFSNRKKNTSFKGYVNGKYYDETVIKLAKRCLGNLEYRKEIQTECTNFLKRYFYTPKDCIIPRLIASVGTFGLTEIFIAATTQSKISEIKKIRKCLVDLLLEKAIKKF